MHAFILAGVALSAAQAAAIGQNAKEEDLAARAQAILNSPSRVGVTMAEIKPISADDIDIIASGERKKELRVDITMDAGDSSLG